MRLKLFIVGLLLIGTIKTSVAQKGQYQFLRLDISNGLSNDQINCIYKDKRGFMWFGTMSGLNKYDGYAFKVFRHDYKNPTSINDDYIGSIYEGPEQKLWIQTRNGLNIYDPLTEQFEHDPQRVLQQLRLPLKGFSLIKKDSKGNYWFLYPDGVYQYNIVTGTTRYFAHTTKEHLYTGAIRDFAEDRQGNIWFVYNDGVFEKLDIKQDRITYRSYVLNHENNSTLQFYKIIIDRDNDIWFYASGSTFGIYYFDPVKNTIKHFDKNSKQCTLNSNLINNIIQDDKGIIWIATDHGGIDLLDKKDFKVSYLLNREDDSKSISQNSGLLYKDNLGIMWFGTYKRGLSYYHENIIKFPVYRHFGSDPNSLPYEDVNRFAEDKTGNLWIGTNGGGLIYFNRRTGKYTQYKHDAQNTNSLASDVVLGLCIDHENKLWIGTYFGGLDLFDGKKFVHYKHSDQDSTTISDDRVWTIMEDSSNRLWVGAFAGGLNQLNRGNNKFIHYKPYKPNSVNSTYISTVFEDKDKNIWCSGYYGIDVLLKRTNRFVHYLHDGKNPNSLIMNNVNCITQDSRGLIWIGTLEGLNVLDPKTKKFTLLTKDNGLPDNTVINVLEDDEHRMWLSTPKGLSKVTLLQTNNGYSYQFANFDETDGLQGREFNLNAALKTHNGEIIFGGAKGFNLFIPGAISYNKTNPELALTDLQIFNKSLIPGEITDGHVILSRSITETNSLALKYNENAFSLNFADLNFFNPGKIKIEYKLENFDKSWLTSDIKARKATYTNLDPGTYIFKVRAVNANGKLSTNPITLQIKISPPFWKTGLAYFIYITSFLSVLFYIRKSGIKKIETKFALERERQAAQHMHELDMMKIEFFTNVSHEFRTPISLILAPVEKMLKEADDKSNLRKLQLIHQNGKRLLNMINQLLDFSKIAVHKLQLDLTEGDIVKNIEEACSLFTDIADKKQIKFLVHVDADIGLVFFDQDKIEKIIFNLLSNALKFTPERGVVEVEMKKPDAGNSEMVLLEIKVKDSGIGIPTEKHNKIFERFYQNEMPASMINHGSGIGLSITKEFITLMGGAISLESEPGKGSCFIVRLPLKVSKNPKIVLQDKEHDQVRLVKPETVYHEKRDKNISILIVEDNPDFRTYLKEEVSHYYTVIEASNGKEGWQKALSLHPKLIISDINMPEIDGLDFCKKIRSDKRTEHIPFILLTAFTGEEQHLVGLETGANDYLTKPFNFEILHFKIRNLLKHQQSVKETYQKQIEAKPGELDIETPDIKFMKKVLTVVEKNISNTSFSVELLSSEMNMSRVALYKKIFSLSGKTPIEFIKSVRLKRAVQLLETNQYTISEIAYQVGYNDPKYFTKAFKSEFAVLPSHYFSTQANKR